MRNDLRGIHTERRFDYPAPGITYISSVTDPYPVWSARRPKPKMASHSRRQDKARYTFYTLPNGAKANLEQIVLFVPLERLFAHRYQEFSIEEIRFDAYFRFKLELSWKQVRDALYRLNHGKLLFRHIAKGTYTWNTNS